MNTMNTVKQIKVSTPEDLGGNIGNDTTLCDLLSYEQYKKCIDAIEKQLTITIALSSYLFDGDGHECYDIADIRLA